MQLTGVVKNGMVVLDGQPTLAEGTRVRVEADEEAGTTEVSEHLATLSERLLRLAGTVRGLPPDMAENHDHYLHGRPKR